MRVYQVIGAVGRALIAGGVLILLFVAYQLWGTGLREAQAQSDLQADFERSLTTTTTEAPEAPDDAPPTSAAPRAATPQGDAVAVIRIPRIDVEKAVVEGVSIADLKKGPGRYPDTPLPGQRGNAAIAGHRTTYGAPFGDLDALQPGDEILVTTRDGAFRYLVDETRIVRPDQLEVLDPTEDARLTLTTCHPRFSARQRLVVTAVLDGEPNEPLPEEPVEPEPDDPDEPGAADTDGEPDGGDSLSGQVIGGDAPAGDPDARAPALLWGGVAAAIWLAAWALARRWRPVPAYALGLAPFAVALFLFFENLARLFPASV